MTSRPLGRWALRVVPPALALALTVSLVSPAHAAEISLSPCTASSLTEATARILSDTNAARRSAGLSAYIPDQQMDTVAQNWSQQQASVGKMSHNPNFSTQIAAGWKGVAENVAAGYTVAAVTPAWLNSAGHRANILRASYTHIGLGVACGARGLYFTQVFAQYPLTRTTPAPVAVSAVAGEQSATVTWTMPVSSSAVTQYRVTASPGGTSVTITGVGGAPPARTATITGLAGNTSYRFTVVATSGLGASAASNPSAPVTVLAPPPPVVPGTADRQSGQDRYQTSAAISAATFAPGIDVVYLASGATFPDALSGSAAAGVQGGAVLLAEPRGIPTSVQNELRRLSPARIVLLGGPAVLSETVRQQAQGLTTGSVERLAGVDRFETSALIARDAFESGVDTVFLTSGANFPDALAAGAASGALGAPLLLVTAGELPRMIEDELARLKPATIYVLGGPTIISDAVLTKAGRYTRTPGDVARIEGHDRYATASAISALAFTSGVPVAYIADGMNFPDALSGSAAAALLGGPVILTSQATLPAAVHSELRRLNPSKVIALGGESSVSYRALAEAASHASPR